MFRSIMARTSILLSFLAAPAGVVACSVAQEGEDAVSSSDDLRRLTGPEIVGTIAYGETKSVTYSAEPRYRALSFLATEGDIVDARFVGEKGLDTVGFLLSDTFATLTSNDDESANSRASRFTYQIPETGLYYLAFREANEEDGVVAITLSKTGEVTPPIDEPPPPPTDFFDPQSCTGETLTQARAIKYFPKGSVGGTKTISKAAGKIYLRARTCSEFSGCSDWVDGKSDHSAFRLPGLEHAYFPYVESNVTLSLNDRANDPIDVNLSVVGIRYKGSDTRTVYALALPRYVGPSTAALVPSSSESWYRTLGAGLDIPVAQADLNVVPVVGIGWEVALNETCAQARFSTVKVSSGKQQQFEMQGVVHWELLTP